MPAYMQTLKQLSISHSREAWCLLVAQPPKPESHGNQLPKHIIFFSFSYIKKKKKKKKKGCNHSIVQSVTFVSFSSWVFSIRWQGLQIIKFEMDSHSFSLQTLYKLNNKGTWVAHFFRPWVQKKVLVACLTTLHQSVWNLSAQLTCKYVQKS